MPCQNHRGEGITNAIAKGLVEIVERGDGSVARLLGLRVPLPDVEATGLIGGAVGRRGELEPAVLGGQPRLAVELAGRARAEVAGRDVDDPVWQLDRPEHPLLPFEQPPVLSGSVLDPAPYEHLDLVELVHADDPASVLAVRAGLAA